MLLSGFKNWEAQTEMENIFIIINNSTGQRAFERLRLGPVRSCFCLINGGKLGQLKGEGAPSLDTREGQLLSLAQY